MPLLDCFTLMPVIVSLCFISLMRVFVGAVLSGVFVLVGRVIVMMLVFMLVGMGVRVAVTMLIRVLFLSVRMLVRMGMFMFMLVFVFVIMGALHVAYPPDSVS